MTNAALGLVLVAACFHATWNALTKRSTDRFAFLYLSLFIAGVLPTIPALVFFADAIPLAGAPFIAASIAIHSVYFFALSRAYQSGEFSQVYPIARGLGVALVPMLALALFDEHIGIYGVMGIGLVVCGGVVVGLSSVERGSTTTRPKLGPGLAWALLTGLLIASYSLVDRAGVQVVHPVPYITLMGFGTVACLTPMAWKKRVAVAAEWKIHRRTIALAAATNLSGYLLVLFAFGLSKTGYVVATRELSIVLSVIVGKLLFGESRLPQRLVGAGLILAGVAALVTTG